MPIHEYRCRHCNHDFEELVRTAEQTIACPACHSDDVQRKMSVFGAVVKNSAMACGVDRPCATKNACCSGGSCPHSH